MKINNTHKCKKSLQTVDCNIQQDKLYEITKISYKHIMINTECTNKFGDNVYECFSTTKECNVSPFYFYDYFYTNQELRKIKLNKIINKGEIIL